MIVRCPLRMLVSASPLLLVLLFCLPHGDCAATGYATLICRKAPRVSRTCKALAAAAGGANLLQVGFTKVCPMGWMLKKLGVPEKA